MERTKRLRSISEEKRNSERGKKCHVSQDRKANNVKENLLSRGKDNHKASLIPVPRGEKADPKCSHHNQRKCYSSSKICYLSATSSKTSKQFEDFDAKLKLLEEKEKSIAQYYIKVEDLIRKLTESEQADNGKPPKRKLPRKNSEARKMTSEPLVCNKNKTSEDILSDLENNVQQISKIWLQASTDLSSTLKHLKSNPSLDPMEFELEKVRIQLAIKQTKSLTLVKTRDILAEARKLFRHREMIRTELENIMNYEKQKEENYGCLKEDSCLEEKDTTTSLESENKQIVGGTGDTPIEESDLEYQEANATSNESNEKEPGRMSVTEEESSAQDTSQPQGFSCEGKQKEENLTPKQSKAEKPGRSSTTKPTTMDMEAMAREISKKNETIANLHNKIFELQKACNEESYKSWQLQIGLSQSHEKNEWNRVLWKQIGKLKEQIKGLQQSNKQLESQKRELECKITRLDAELDRLIKLNHFLNQRKYLLSAQETFERECQCLDHRRVEDSSRANTGTCDLEKSSEERLFAEKQNAINQLKTILNVMKDQENFAQKQVSIFQKKIEELERNTKA